MLLCISLTKHWRLTKNLGISVIRVLFCLGLDKGNSVQVGLGSWFAFERSPHDSSLCPATRLCLSSRVNSAHSRNTYFLLAGHTRTARLSVLDLDSAPPPSLLWDILLPGVRNSFSGWLISRWAWWQKSHSCSLSLCWNVLNKIHYSWHHHL